ncbi:ABC transporter permease subunit [Streptomyces sp. x-80]|uniref:ABC transporter permease subunit n=1 Tax=Streptomyces sp. x-80 TaxID=2789282 RepID=UPI003980CBF5
MSTEGTTRAHPVPGSGPGGAAAADGDRFALFGAVLRAEWTKIRSLPSLYGSLAAVVLMSAAITLVAAGTDHATHTEPGFDPLFYAFYGVNFGQLAAVAFGVAAVAGEWSGGTIRVSLVAVPRRATLYAAKLTVVGGLALAAGLLTGLACFFGGEAVLGRHGVRLGAPGALPAVLGCGLYLALLTLLAAGVAALLRSPVGALSLLLPLVVSVSPLLGSIDATKDLAQFLPDRAGQQILHTVPEGALTGWTGLAAMTAWAAVTVWAGGRGLARRDQ